MRRPFDPAVDCHIDFLRDTVAPGIASSVAKLLIGAQEALLKAREQVAAVRKAAPSSEPEVNELLVPISAEAARTLDGIEREAGGYVTRLGQLEGQHDTGAPDEYAEVRQAHAAVVYVLREKRRELERLIPEIGTAQTGVLYAT